MHIERTQGQINRIDRINSEVRRVIKGNDFNFENGNLSCSVLSGSDFATRVVRLTFVRVRSVQVLNERLLTLVLGGVFAAT